MIHSPQNSRYGMAQQMYWSLPRSPIALHLLLAAIAKCIALRAKAMDFRVERARIWLMQRSFSSMIETRHSAHIQWFYSYNVDVQCCHLDMPLNIMIKSARKNGFTPTPLTFIVVVVVAFWDVLLMKRKR